jgi:hypothetical protein
MKIDNSTQINAYVKHSKLITSNPKTNASNWNKVFSHLETSLNQKDWEKFKRTLYITSDYVNATGSESVDFIRLLDYLHTYCDKGDYQDIKEVFNTLKTIIKGMDE